jgi:hypothetical protein
MTSKNGGKGMLQKLLGHHARMVVFSFLIGVIAITVSSCATALPVPVKGDETLLLIYVKAPVMTQSEVFSKIDLRFVDRNEPEILNPMEPYHFVHGMAPGTYSSESFCIVPFAQGGFIPSAWNREEHTQKLRFPFAIKERTIAVFSIRFEYSMKSSSDGHYSYGWRLDSLGIEDMEKIREYVSKMENHDQWELEFPQQKKAQPESPQPESPALKR